MGQLGFFDAEKRLAALSAKGDPLEAIDRLVPWERFRSDIEAVVLTPDEVKKSSAGLQYQHAEQHDRINGFSAGTTLLHLIRRQHDRLDVGTNALPRHASIYSFDRITLRRQRRQPLLSVEEPELTHLRLPNHAVANETRTTQSEWLFFEVPNRPSASSSPHRTGIVVP